MVACRDFEQLALRIVKAAQDPQTRAAPRHIEQRGNIRACCHCLNILCHARQLDLGQPLDLPENRFLVRLDAVNHTAQIGVDIRIDQRDRHAIVRAGAHPAKSEPSPARDNANLFGNRFGQPTFGKPLEFKAAVARILQDFGDVRQRLVQRTAARCRWLDDGARAPFARYQPLALQRAQRLTHRKARHAILKAQHAFGRKLALRERTVQDRSAQVIGHFLIPGFPRFRLGLQPVSPCAVML